MAKLSPLKDFIILELPANAENKIIIPNNADKRKLVEGSSLLVIKTGVDCKNVKVGDRLITDPNAVMTFAFENKQLFLTKEDNVCAVIRSENAS